jgi:hypothetical protein
MPAKRTNRYRKVPYEIISLDVWGNAKDGFTVNNAFRTGRTVEVTAVEHVYNENTPQEFIHFSVSNAHIIRALKREGYIKRNIHHKSIEIDGEQDYTLYVNDARNGCPELQLECKRPKVFEVNYLDKSKN